MTFIWSLFCGKGPGLQGERPLGKLAFSGGDRVISEEIMELWTLASVVL